MPSALKVVSSLEHSLALPSCTASLQAVPSSPDKVAQHVASALQPPPVGVPMVTLVPEPLETPASPPRFSGTSLQALAQLCWTHVPSGVAAVSHADVITPAQLVMHVLSVHAQFRKQVRNALQLAMAGLKTAPQLAPTQASHATAPAGGFMQRGMVPFVPPLVVPGGSSDDGAGSWPAVPGDWKLEGAGSRELSGLVGSVAEPPHATRTNAPGIRQAERTRARMSEVV
jgi:hypothetical protein